MIEGSVQDIARCCNCDIRRIQQLTKEGVLPKIRHGKYDLVATCNAFVRYITRDTKSESKSETQERLRLLSAQADRAELEAAEKKGELVTADGVAEAWLRVGADLRQKILSVPTRSAPVCEGKNVAEIQVIISDNINDALGEFSKQAG